MEHRELNHVALHVADVAASCEFYERVLELDDGHRETLELLEQHDIEVIFLSGYLRKIPTEVLERFPRRILNVHPALLPAFGGKGMYGMNVHRAVIDSGARISGPTVHYVDEEYDEGTIVAQWPVPLKPSDTPEELAARVLRAEHRLYPLAADHVCSALAEGRDPGPLTCKGEVYRLSDAGL